MEWLVAALVAFGNLANATVVPGVPNGSLIVVVWLCVGAWAMYRALQARRTAYLDLRAARAAQAAGRATMREVEAAAGDSMLMRGLLLAIGLLWLLGWLALFSTPAPPQPTELHRTPAQLGSGLIAVITLLSLTYGVNAVVTSRDRWRKLWRAAAARSKGGAS